MNIEAIHIKGRTDRAVILFHGYGASMDDLAPLHQYLDPQGEWHWYFPNGPVRIPFGVQWEGRAWFPIDMAEVERAMQAGTHRDFSASAPAQFYEAVEGAENFVKEVQSKHKEVIIGGFSQGSMLASHIAMRHQVPLKGLVLLSGTLVDRQRLAESKATPLPFFQSHGESDPILGYQHAQSLHKQLTEQGHPGVFSGFRGGHEIPESVLRGLQLFLREQF